jgi:ankyrin repeat protein
LWHSKEHNMPLLRLSLIALFAMTAFAQSATAPWYSAIRENNLALLRTLVESGGTKGSGPGGQTPLMAAASFGSVEAVSLLINAGADPAAVNDSGITALHLAAGDPRKVRLLLEHGAAVNRASLMGRTPLLVAAGIEGTFETVKLLVEQGADVNAADTVGVTPLIAAAFVDNGAVARFLVEKGANVNARGTVGANTALMGASINGNADLTRLLLAHEADVNAISADRGGTVKNGPVAFGNVTSLHLSVSSGSPETVRLLLDGGARVNAQDIRGMTPLMFAVSTDRPNLEIIRMLLARGADPTMASKVKETSADWARKFNNPAVLTLLKTEAAGASAAQASPQKNCRSHRENAATSGRAQPAASATHVSKCVHGWRVRCLPRATDHRHGCRVCTQAGMADRRSGQQVRRGGVCSSD